MRHPQNWTRQKLTLTQPKDPFIWKFIDKTPKNEIQNAMHNN